MVGMQCRKLSVHDRAYTLLPNVKALNSYEYRLRLWNFIYKFLGSFSFTRERRLLRMQRVVQYTVMTLTLRAISLGSCAPFRQQLKRVPCPNNMYALTPEMEIYTESDSGMSKMASRWHTLLCAYINVPSGWRSDRHLLM